MTPDDFRILKIVLATMFLTVLALVAFSCAAFTPVVAPDGTVLDPGAGNDAVAALADEAGNVLEAPPANAAGWLAALGTSGLAAYLEYQRRRAKAAQKVAESKVDSGDASG